MKLIKQTRRSKRGAALVEYGLIVAGVALVAAAAVSIFGTKTAGMIGASAAVLPGANAADNGAIQTGKLIQTVDNGNGQEVDTTTLGNTLGDNLGVATDEMITQPQ
ncbi:MAG: hypothetical protein IPJ77_10565 [Planctomycetes bacterium]|nr:hypothetical protein [Planctomycetota bacterium]